MKESFQHCRSIFRDGKDVPTSEQVTQVWITLINQMERSKALLSGVQ